MTSLKKKYQLGFLILSILISIQITSRLKESIPKSVITQKDLLVKIQTNNLPLILDVRTQQEYISGHIPRAININYQELSDRFDDISAFKKSDIIVYCERGIRAKIANVILQKAGFKSIVYLQGDISKWRSNKLPITKNNELSRSN